MKNKVPTTKSFTTATQLPLLLRSFLKDETASGKLIFIAAILSLIIVNSTHAGAYTNFWHIKFNIGLNLDLRHWLNEALMAFFFLVVGLEIKRELVKGELSNLKVAALPIGAAVGGMIVPALIYLAFNTQAETIRGWGIPIATDIAFAVAVLSLLGKRVPISLKLFLLTLAIADDIGAIFVIALFYAEIIHHGYLFGSTALLAGMWFFRKKLSEHILIYIGFGILLWITTHLSGIHASIVGAALGLLASVEGRNKELPLAHRLERWFLPFSSFVILPLFAFANAGVIISSQAVTSNYSVMVGIIGGLIVGKSLGIALACWLLVRLGVAKLPTGANWGHIIGVGLIAGIGFTVSIFVTELAFKGNAELIDTAKVSIFLASGLSALAGTLILLINKQSNP